MAGIALAAFGERLHAGAAQRVPQARRVPPRWPRWRTTPGPRGAAVDAALALPLYLRDKVALDDGRARSGRAATVAVMSAVLKRGPAAAADGRAASSTR